MSALKARTIFSEGYDLFKKHWKQLIGIILASIAINIIASLGGRSFVGIMLGLVGTIVVAVMRIVTLKFTINIAEGHHTTLQKTFDSLTVRTILRILGAGLLGGVIIFFSLIFFLIPFFFIYPRLAFVPARIIEGHSIKQAFKQSWAMTKGYVWFMWRTIIIGLGLCFLGMMCLIIGIIPVSAIIATSYGRLYVHLRDLHFKV